MRWNKLKYKYPWDDPIWVYNNEPFIFIALAGFGALTMLALVWFLS